MDDNKFDFVDARPVKSFFVHMLTRDIALEDAILDLLDNCVDGILRYKGHGPGPTPYNGFRAEIKFDDTSFSISDNCGGIPWELHEYAFRMGKQDESRDGELPTVGVYGIGMKRAIFKIGKRCLISTQNDEDCYEVEITPDWIAHPDNWDLPVKPSAQIDKTDGTVIVIDELNDGIRNHFGDNKKEFARKLTDMVRTQYAFILDKGFQVIINGNVVEGKATELIFTEIKDSDSIEPAIRPYIYKTEANGVSIFLSVGFVGPIPSQDETMAEQEKRRFSSLDAGWTVICNDRAVLFHDRTVLTGWGDAGVPRYHTQFIAIAGIVEFKSNDAMKLPTTTTKRGIDASSTLYLNVRQMMIDGMKIFTNYTNKWKSKAAESKKHMNAGRRYTFDELKIEFDALPISRVIKGLGGHKFQPKLPLPDPEPSSKRRISYDKDVGEIEDVKGYLFDEEDANASEVGEKCFDVILKEARR